MKKRIIKKDRIIACLLVVLLILPLITYSIIYLTSNNIGKSPNKKQSKPKEIVQKEKRMSLVAVGDVLIHGAVYMDAALGNNQYDFSKMFTEVSPLIKDYDLKYYNQETIIGGKNLGVQHYPRFNSPDEIALNLMDIGFNMVGLANNHTLDMNEAGILNSVKFWRDKKVIVSGQSDSVEDRNDIKVYEKNGIKYAFIAYTDTTNGLTIPRGKDYLVNVYSDEQAKIDIEKIKDKTDVIIVSMHWGEEYTHTPTERQKEEAEYLSSLGVNLIIGSHPHVIQPVDYVGDTLVMYSLGNFISGQSPLGIDKIIGLMAGMDIVVKDNKVTFDKINYKLLYTYCVNDIRDYKVIPFDKLNNDILNNYQSLEKEYLNIVNSGV